MKFFLILAAMLTAGCATEHRAPAGQLQGVYIDCTNRAAFESYFNKQLSLTDMQQIEKNPQERQYYAAIKDRLWTLRSDCQ